MIDDVSQKLKIGFEQYIMAKEEEIRKLNEKLASKQRISDSLISENQQLVQNLDEAKKENKQLAQGQGEAMAECSMLEYKLEETQAENQKLSKKLDEARDEISCKDITIRRMKKDAERKDTAMQADTSEVKEKFAREMIDSGIRFVKDMKTAIDDSQTFKCMGLLNHMTDDCFGKHEPIHRELKDMIQGILAVVNKLQRSRMNLDLTMLRLKKEGCTMLRFIIRIFIMRWTSRIFCLRGTIRFLCLRWTS